MPPEDLSPDSGFFRALRLGLIRHLAANALLRDGPYTLASGRTSSWYLDARRTTYSGAGAALVGRCVLEVMNPVADAIGGMTMGADPIAVAAVTLASLDDRELKAFSVRKAPKEHGTGGRLVGPLEQGDRAVVVEDTTTTGTSMLEAVDVLRDAGIGVIQAITVVDRSGGEVGERLAALDIPFVVLVTPADLGVE